MFDFLKAEVRIVEEVSPLPPPRAALTLREARENTILRVFTPPIIETEIIAMAGIMADNKPILYTGTAALVLTLIAMATALGISNSR